MKNKARILFKKYNHVLAVLYFAIYLPWFLWLNKVIPGLPDDKVVFLYSKLDDYVIFNEWFAIPYFLWFLYVAVFFCYFMLTSKPEFIRLIIFLYTGMTVCLLIYMIIPNGYAEKAMMDFDALGRSNILIDMIRNLHESDPPYNVCPSIHCLNSFGIHIAVLHSKKLRKRPVIVWASGILAFSIVLSTVYVKQHSVWDILWAVILAVPLYLLAYKVKWGSLKKGEPEISAA